MSNPYYDAPLVLVDLETTGANALRDRITEIGIVQIDADGCRRWSALVNPQQPIPAFIQQLTGIDDAMVADAPPFADLADEVFARLQGRVFVAHNARFDYGFLRSEFKRLGRKLVAPVLCTVKLSKQLYPTEFKHSLDTLIARHGLVFEGDRHRALTDAVLLEQFLAVLVREHGRDTVAGAIAELTNKPALPPGVDPQVADELPESAGVFAFYDASGQALLVARAPNIRKRVLQYFAPAKKLGKVSRDMASTHILLQQTTRIDWTETAGEFGALLLEQRWLRQLAPRLNPQARRDQELCAWQLETQDNGLLRPQLVALDGLDLAAGDALYGPFRSRREARALLSKLADANGLCRQVLGLEVRPKTGKGCAACALGKTGGICVASEPAAGHNARLLFGLARHRFAAWPYPDAIALPEGPEWAPALHVILHWCYLGTIHDPAELPALLAESVPQFDVDSYKLIQKELKARDGKVQLFS
ncbi:exonuclease domain-containing protein [Chitinilyticum aquatile]|uniref:exonuclease domain-containing protein n=1 Tax=Chitinilyticum aquatile TaxID=362520 RepID=UPI0003FE2C7F|nr:exonuclease domain-containing protein [Chitinilyticum aquatile]